MAEKQTKSVVDQGTFATRLVMLSDAFGLSINKARIEAYWTRLHRFDLDLFYRVCDHIMDNNDRFPTIAEFHRVSRDKFNREITDEYTSHH